MSSISDAVVVVPVSLDAVTMTTPPRCTGAHTQAQVLLVLVS
jgi:hypothetical protein